MLDKTKASAVPVFQLYGEPATEEELATLHVEPLVARMRLHNWEIRPHRHDGLHQVFLIETGGGEALMDDAARAVEGPCLIAVPPLLVHGFRYAPGAEGYVVTVSARLVAQVAAAWGESGLSSLLNTPLFVPLPRPLPSLTAAFEGLAREFREPSPWRASALTARLGLLLIEIARAQPAATLEADLQPSFALMQAFRSLLEAHVAEHRSVGDYARDLSVTKARLNAVCQRFAGRSPLQLIHDRLLLEAKRNLIHTSMSVGEVGYALGFRDPAYFCRFFARNAGCPPSAFRRRREAGR